jgi:hypothetical protein
MENDWILATISNSIEVESDGAATALVSVNLPLTRQTKFHRKTRDMNACREQLVRGVAGQSVADRMAEEKMSAKRSRIMSEFSLWVAMSAARQGSPLRGRKLYPFLQSVDLEAVLDQSHVWITEEFQRWHEDRVVALLRQRVSRSDGVRS